ncbi:hypothetical protein ACFPOB_20770 [Bosea eneae]|uniref:Uncharacterized protein n=1 Tax=Bosea eneae TaxID=151454 RepID=A0ABW0IXG1_9HYPH
MPNLPYRPSSNSARWREIVLLRRRLVSLKAQARLLRHELARKYNPDQPRVPAGNADGGQWTSGGGGGDPTLTGTDFLGDLGSAFSAALSFGDVVADTSGEESWAFYQDATRNDGSLAERSVVNRDGSTIQSEFAEPDKPSDWDERHIVTLPEGGKTTFETADRTQTIRDGDPDGEIVSRSTWTERGPEREATVHEAFAPAIVLAPGAAQTTITSALTLFTWLSARNKVDGLEATIAFNARDYRPGEAPGFDLGYVGQISRSEAEAACRYLPELQSRLDAAVATVGPANKYPSMAVYGTYVHTNMKNQIITQNYPDLKAERSFLKESYEPTSETLRRYGYPDTVRYDAYELRADGTLCLYDFKAGRRGLSLVRSDIMANAARYGFASARRIIVLEVRPSK